MITIPYHVIHSRQQSFHCCFRKLPELAIAYIYHVCAILCIVNTFTVQLQPVFLYFHRDFSKNCTQDNGGLTLPIPSPQQTHVTVVYDAPMLVKRSVRPVPPRSRHSLPLPASFPYCCPETGTSSPSHHSQDLDTHSHSLPRSFPYFCQTWAQRLITFIPLLRCFS